MASIVKTPDGTYRVKIRRKGYPAVSKNFEKKTHAQRWATQVEAEMARGIFVSMSDAEKFTIAEMMDQYSEKIVPEKKSDYDVRCRLRLLRPHFGHLTLAALTPTIVKEYRDMRLKIRKPDTVRKELGVLSRVVGFAVDEHQIYLPKGNPVRGLAPPKPKGRERRLHHGEDKKLLAAVKEYGGHILHIMQFAVETGMRRGEMTKLLWKDVNFKNRTATARDTKNGDDRVVPLSLKAIEILHQLPREGERVFPIRPDSATQAFSRACERAGIKDLRLHDLRHEATSRFFEKGLEVMEVATAIGHKDLAMLMRYTHLRPENIAKKLD